MTPTPELTTMKACLDAANHIYLHFESVDGGFILGIPEFEAALAMIPCTTPPSDNKRDEILQRVVDHRARFYHQSCCVWELAHDLHHILVLPKEDDSVN